MWVRRVCSGLLNLRGSTRSREDGGRRMIRRPGLVASLAGVAVLALTVRASASFHLNKIREITGDTAGGNQSYIELQMYASGENFVSGHNITVWDADAFVVSTYQPIATHTLTDPNPPNG